MKDGREGASQAKGWSIHSSEQGSCDGRRDHAASARACCHAPSGRIANHERLAGWADQLPTHHRAELPRVSL